ncbi:MAG: exodeoxyribonuclease VII small subunit [Armatimonadetes bacterium]|nr:exodeoxyribonuclease VII small subunit [Armatimonadota bacterium]
MGQALSFEDAMRRLEEIVAALESGNLNLADSLAQFEEGMALARACEQQLQEAESKVELLTNSGSALWSPEAAEDRDQGF